MATNSGGWLYEATGTPVDKATADNAQARVLEIKQTADGAAAGSTLALARSNTAITTATQAKVSADQTAAGQAQAIADATTARSQSTQAIATAGSAVTIAQGAVADVDEIKGPIDTRLSAVEVAAGYAPGDATDAAMTNIATQEGTEFRAVLDVQTAKVAAETVAGFGASDAVQPFLSIIENGTKDAHLLMIGDSTGDESWEWVRLFFEGLAEKNPGAAFHYRLWQDASQTWDTPIIIGAGARTVTIWNASVPGSTTQYWLAARFTPAIAAIPADLVLISLGHNEGSGTTYSWSWRARYLALTESLRAQKPTATLVLVGQNPARANNWQAERIAVYKEIAARQGYGFIDAHAAFIEAGGDLTIDGIHPSPAGARLWADVMLEAFTRTKAAPRPQQASMLKRRTVENKMPNGDLKSWVGDLPTGWTLAGATVAKDTTGMESGDAAATITSTAANGGIYVNLDASKVAGKTFTLAVRAKVHAGATMMAGRIGFYDTTGSRLQAAGSDPTDGYRWILHEGTFAEGTTTARVYIYAGDTGSKITVDRIIINDGIEPSDAAELTVNGGSSGGGGSVPSNSWNTPAGLAPSADVTVESMMVKRIGSTVYCRLLNMAMPAGSVQRIVANIPAGYRSNGGPSGAVSTSWTQLMGTGNSDPKFLQYMTVGGGNLWWTSAYNTVTQQATSSPARIDGIFMWHTDDPFPV